MGPLFAAQIITPQTTVSFSTTRTLVQLKAATSTGFVCIVAYWVSFSDPTMSVRTRLARQTSAGSASALTITKLITGLPAAGSTASYNFSSTEPTTTDILWEQYVVGFVHIQLPLGDEVVLAPDERIGLIVTTSAGQSLPGIEAGMWFREG